MKSTAITAALLVSVFQYAQAEPVFMPQAASVLKGHQAQTGVGGQFGYQSYELEGAPGTVYKNRVWQIPVFARVGLMDDAEAKLMVPIVHAIDSKEGSSGYHNEDGGLGNMQVGAKWNFLKGMIPVAAALDLDLPTANSKNNPGSLGERYSNQLQQGFNTHLQLIADSPLMADRVTGHVAVGYMNTATYTTSFKSQFNPSDLMTFGASVDVRLHAVMEGLSSSLELVGNTALNHSKTNGSMNGNDKGTVLEIGPALRYQHNAMGTYAGFLADAGKSTFRAYNYRVNFGVSYLFGAH